MIFAGQLAPPRQPFTALFHRSFSQHYAFGNHLCIFPKFTAGFILIIETALERSSGLSPQVMIPYRLYTLIPGGIAALFLAYFVFRRKPANPTELELQRRVWLEKVGRITDGTVIDVQEHKSGRPACHAVDLPLRRGWCFL